MEIVNIAQPLHQWILCNNMRFGNKLVTADGIKPLPVVSEINSIKYHVVDNLLKSSDRNKSDLNLVNV